MAWTPSLAGTGAIFAFVFIVSAQTGKYFVAPVCRR